MVEITSSLLLRRLIEWNLCTAADLRRCRARVRKLARDLPAFDSVWIDALVQARRLTPFQASLLETDPDEIVQGPCLLVDRLGRGPDAATFLARLRAGNERCVLKLVSGPVETLPQDLERLASLIEKLEGHAHPFAAAPHAALEQEGRIVLVSRYVPGLHLGQLLVRRGRFQPEYVAAIARQLVDGLASLEQRGAIHGDIRLNNVRLTEQGAAVLVDAGVAPALRPELFVHWGHPPDRYDGVAPESIATGREADAASDLYALGCLMWQLLAGRPPFPTGDPLAKLAAHQTKPIADVREWAPDTPPPLAEMIRRFTAFDRAQRPRSFAEVAERIGRPRRGDRRKLSRFVACFNTALPSVPRLAGGFRSTRWPATLAALFVLSGAVLALVDQGARSELLHIAARVSKRLGIEGAAEPAGATTSNEPADMPRDPAHPELLPLPAPNADGVILLETDGPYAAAEVSVVGALSIRGARGRTPEIVVTDRPLELWAESVTLDNVHLSHVRPRAGANDDELSSAASAHAAPQSLVVVRALDLAVAGCSFRDASSGAMRDAPSAANARIDPTRTAILWIGLDPRNAARTRIRVKNTVFATYSDGAAVGLATSPGRIDFENCLATGGGPLIEAQSLPTAGSDLRIAVGNVTLRESAGLLRVAASPARSGGRFLFDARDCVFDLAADGALFQLSPAALSAGVASEIEMTGEGSLISAGARIAARHPRPIESAGNSTEPEIALEGLVAASFEFAASERSPAACGVISWNAPRRSSAAPGIDATALAIPAGPPAEP
ncbi:MAG: serine/threonine-protein kinase [Planctomycetaceae bacterium]